MKNLFNISDVSFPLQEENFVDLLKAKGVRIERIVSTGQTSPKDFWYDQSENEWVSVLEGQAILSLKDKSGVITTHTLKRGDYINLPACTKHRVEYTDTSQPTIWLAVFY